MKEDHKNYGRPVAERNSVPLASLVGPDAAAGTSVASRSRPNRRRKMSVWILTIRIIRYQQSIPKTRPSHHACGRLTLGQAIKRTSSSVSKPGQNSKSSSKSNDLPASKRARNADTGGDSASSFILLTPRNCRCEFWDEDGRGALRDRAAW